MNTLNRNKVGLIVASFVALVHIIWSALVALEWAQPLQDFMLEMHFLVNPYLVLPFDWVTAIELIVLASIAGYIVGFVLATIWNHFHRG
ncbi:MAG: hypothetical protein AAB488_01270 [Patescibacteria group bacterium]